MEILSFAEDCLNDIEYEFNKDEIINLDSMLYDWMDRKTYKILIVKAKTIKTKEDVIAIYIYYSRKNSYGRSGSHDASKSYHLYNGKVYGKLGIIKTVPKEVKMSLKEIGIDI